MDWKEKIDRCLSSPHCRPSQKQFLVSVRQQIERYGDVFPTMAQQIPLGHIIRHVEKRDTADVLGGAKEYLAL